MLRLLRQFGIEEVRCEFDYVSAGEGQKFVRVASDMVDRLRALVPCIPKTSMPRPMPRYPEGRGELRDVPEMPGCDEGSEGAHLS